MSKIIGFLPIPPTVPYGSPMQVSFISYPLESVVPPGMDLASLLLNLPSLCNLKILRLHMLFLFAECKLRSPLTTSLISGLMHPTVCMTSLFRHVKGISTTLPQKRAPASTIVFPFTVTTSFTKQLLNTRFTFTLPFLIPHWSHQCTGISPSLHIHSTISFILG